MKEKMVESQDYQDGDSEQFNLGLKSSRSGSTHFSREDENDATWPSSVFISPVKTR